MDKQTRYGKGPFVEHLSQELGLVHPPQLIRHYTNLIYDCDTYIARLTPNTVRSQRAVERELHWMAFVGKHTKDVVRLIECEGGLTQQVTFEEEHFTLTLCLHQQNRTRHRKRM